MQHTMQGIKSRLQAYCGCPVRLHAIGERNKTLDTLGVLEAVYPQVFVVRSDSRRYCYAYREILTRHVQVQPAVLPEKEERRLPI